MWKIPKQIVTPNLEAYPELRLLFRGVVILLVKSLTVMW